MELIRVQNKKKKTVINSTYENFVCKSRKVVQIKRLKNVSIESMPAFGPDGSAQVGYMSTTLWPDDKKAALMTTVLSPDVFPTPPLIAVTAPKDYNFTVYWRTQNDNGIMRFVHYVQVRRNDDKNITVEEIWNRVDLYVYDFLAPQGQKNGYGRTQEGVMGVHDGAWKLWYKVFVNEGMYRGDLNNHVELNWQALRKPRPNLTALKDYPDIDKCKCGVQVYGYHRFWNERFHSPKADKRSAEIKKKKGKLERYSADLLYDSRLPWLVVLGQVQEHLKYSTDGGYLEGDIRRSHIDSIAYSSKIGVIVSSVIEGTAMSKEVAHTGLIQYSVRQGLTFTSENAVSTVEADERLPTVANYPIVFNGSPSLDYLVVNIDGVQPNTVDEFS